MPKTIEVAGFAPWAAKQRKEPYPDALVKLGCTILKTRSDVYGDEVSAKMSQTEECKRALAIH